MQHDATCIVVWRSLVAYVANGPKKWAPQPIIRLELTFFAAFSAMRHDATSFAVWCHCRGCSRWHDHAKDCRRCHASHHKRFRPTLGEKIHSADHTAQALQAAMCTLFWQCRRWLPQCHHKVATRAVLQCVCARVLGYAALHGYMYLHKRAPLYPNIRGHT